MKIFLVIYRIRKYIKNCINYKKVKLRVFARSNFFNYSFSDCIFMNNNNLLKLLEKEFINLIYILRNSDYKILH